MAEFKFPARLTQGNGVATVTAFNESAENPVMIANEYHPHWDDILAGLRAGDPNVWDLFDVASGVMRRLRQVTDRVAFDGRNVLFDGDPIHSVLSDQLRRAIQDGDSDTYVALAQFWEKLASNPSKDSQEQVYRFLANHKFQITLDGDVVAYKSVTVQPDGSFMSGFASREPEKASAFVNGVPIAPLSRVPQKVGDEVTLPRSEVVADPTRSCERGLHVGTRNYFARGWGKEMIEVHVNPRDFVSVPNNEDAKARVCRYRVAGVADEHLATDEGAPVLRKTETVWAGDVGYKPV